VNVWAIQAKAKKLAHTLMRLHDNAKQAWQNIYVKFNESS
jgi:hypothetical protein